MVRTLWRATWPTRRLHISSVGQLSYGEIRRSLMVFTPRNVECVRRFRVQRSTAADRAIPQLSRMGPKMTSKPRSTRANAAVTNNLLDGPLLGARSLIEDDVYDATGKCLGEVEDVVLDARTGCVRYAVVALGGFLGMGCKRFAVPWRALTPDADYRRCVLDESQMRLTAVPIPNHGQRSRARLRWDGKLPAS